jgi:maleylacetoacetate isomerase
LHVACEIQPLNNSAVEAYLAKAVGASDEALVAWRQHWIRRGFDAVEAMLAAPETGRFCHGDEPGMADCFLVPQVYKALQPTAGLDMSAWPRIERVYRACLERETFARAMPERQPDFAPG